MLEAETGQNSEIQHDDPAAEMPLEKPAEQF